MKENSIEFHCAKLTQKERDIAKYMSGYVFGTLYRRIRCSKQHKQILNMQSLSILLAGKSEVEDNDNEPDNIFVKAKNKVDYGWLPQKFLRCFCLSSHTLEPT